MFSGGSVDSAGGSTSPARRPVTPATGPQHGDTLGAAHTEPKHRQNITEDLMKPAAESHICVRQAGRQAGRPFVFELIACVWTEAVLSLMPGWKNRGVITHSRLLLIA